MLPLKTNTLGAENIFLKKNPPIILVIDKQNSGKKLLILKTET